MDPELTEQKKQNRIAEKQRLKGTLFLDSAKLGTYRKPQEERNKKIRPGFARRHSA